MSDSKRKRGDQPDTRPQPPRLPPEMADDEATRFQSPENDTQALPPMKLPEERPQPPRRPPPPSPVSLERRPTPTVAQVMEKPKRSGATPLQPQEPPPPLLQPTRSRGSSLSLPIWSVALMLFMVCGAVSCMVLAVVSLGGRTVPASPPQFLIVTAVVPTNTAFVPPPIAPSPVVSQGALAGTVSSFALIGPTLAPIEISPTPVNIALGIDVVVDAEESGVNVRSGAGIANQRLFVAPNGSIFRVIDGPAQADGLTWWQIQNTVDPNQVGWAAAAYLEVVLPGVPLAATP
jgi:hypothetical protein